MQTFEDADNLYTNKEFEKGFDQLKARHGNGENSCELLWRMARFCHDLATTLAGDQRKRVILEGRDFGLLATEVDPSNFEAAKWAAILFGLAVDMMSMKEKINEGGKLKDMLDRALELEPTDFALLHLRGRFSFTIANLSWFDRKAAAILYNELPKATIDDALVDFEAAEKTHADWIENLLYLSKCYLAKKEKSKTREYLQKAINLPADTASNIDLVNQCKTMLQKI